MTLSQLIGVLLVLVGLYLVVTGAPAVSGQTGEGLWPLLREIFKEHPRVAIGIILIILGLTAIGVDLGPVIWGNATMSPSPTPTPTPS